MPKTYFNSTYPVGVCCSCGKCIYKGNRVWHYGDLIFCDNRDCMTEFLQTVMHAELKPAGDAEVD